ncbi:MAG TPA: efflux RND transporter periplasmic adaptor subunit [Planctomycetes bacterium]|nr:efflux RND transporter periplasmic adaptor subunit [Planctomycetota bacterium]
MVTSPIRSDTVLTRDYVCQIHAIRRIELRALERGYLEGVFVDEGKSVKEGQRMFQVMPMLLQAELEKAEAEAEASRIEWRNTQLLAKKDVVSTNELALAKAKLDKAKAELSLCAAHRKLTTVRAPFSGIMGLLEVRRGSLIEEGELLTTLCDNSQMWVYFNVTESEYLAYQASAEADRPVEVELVLANGEVFAHRGVISTIESEFNNETGTIAFRATFPNPEGLLRHGQTGNVRLATDLPQALLIPQKATFEVLDKKYVFVVDEQNVIHQRSIQIAHELDHIYVVQGGLAEGDKVLLEGLRKVVDGEKIRPKFEDPVHVLTHLDLEAD